jgi:predicted glutamine amidotransferase
MCRWNAYSGAPVLIDELLYRTQHGLIDQSLHSRMGAETTNGDGFGLGWYSPGIPEPGRYRSVNPAWNDANLRDLAGHVESHLFVAHIRAAIGSPVQQTNCHPFRHDRWLFVHNGFIDGFRDMRRELLLGLDPAVVDAVEGSTDSEVLFGLARTFGMEDDPLGALERAVGFIETTGWAKGVEHPMQGTLGLTDGERLWAVRYSTAHQSRSLFISQDVDTLRQLHPDSERLRGLSADARVVVSEPVSDLPGAWLEVAESSAVLIQPGPDEHVSFNPDHGAAARIAADANLTPVEGR